MGRYIVKQTSNYHPSHYYIWDQKDKVVGSDYQYRDYNLALRQASILNESDRLENNSQSSKLDSRYWRD